MRFWWVNHKQTNKKELDGGYIWSPKHNKNKSRNQTYINLTLAKPGDPIISYADTVIKAIGVVSEPAIEAPKPSEFGAAGNQWENDGWLVKVDWERLENPPSPKRHIDLIRPLLPERYSPIQANGNGNQSCYLAEIGEQMYQVILDITGVEGKQVNELLEQDTAAIADENEEKKVRTRTDIPETEIEQLVKARRGQGVYKSNLLEVESHCRLTGVNDRRFLIASHIKPWRHCNDREKLDGNNGLLLAPHVDKLFDQGWISFADNGALLIYSDELIDLLNLWKLPIEANAGNFNLPQKQYLAHHRAQVFKG